MNRFDLKHTAFHILVALYFIWVFVFAILLAMAVSNVLEPRNAALTSMFPMWILMNLVMGSALFVVIRLFRSRAVAETVGRVSYIALAAGGLCIMILSAASA